MKSIWDGLLDPVRQVLNSLAGGSAGVKNMKTITCIVIAVAMGLAIHRETRMEHWTVTITRANGKKEFKTYAEVLQ